MTKKDLCRDIDALAAEYLGHSVTIARPHWPKARLTRLHSQYTRMIRLFRQANALKARFTREEWHAVVISQDSAEDEDLVQRWADLTNQAVDIWLSPEKHRCSDDLPLNHTETQHAL